MAKAPQSSIDCWKSSPFIRPVAGKRKTGSNWCLRSAGHMERRNCVCHRHAFEAVIAGHSVFKIEYLTLSELALTASKAWHPASLTWHLYEPQISVFTLYFLRLTSGVI